MAIPERNVVASPTTGLPSYSRPHEPSLDGEFLQALGVAVYTTDAEGVITRYNDAAAELWGREPEIGKDKWCGSWKLYDANGDPMAHDACPMGIALKEDRAVRGVEAIAERPDGTRVSFVPYPTPLHDASGNLVGAVNVLVDITARKEAEQAAAYLNAIITSSEDAIVSKDLQGTVTSWNAGAERLFGFSADEMIGRSIRTVIPDDRQAEEDDVLGRVRAGKRIDHYETLRRRKDGSLVPVSLTVSPVRDSNDRIVGASKIARDITERRAAEQAISEALAIKDEFIGLVSHELRTPLTAVLGNATILARKGSRLDEEMVTSAAADILAGSLRLSGVIEDLLSLARLEGGHIEQEPIALARVVERRLRDYSAQDGRPVSLRIDDRNCVVLADDRVITHVLNNYLLNAERYSPKGSTIEVIVDTSADTANVRVLDRGIGIDPAEADKLFESFYRSENVGTIGGIGIGLSVCRRLTNAVGGTCWAAPRDGGGSEFVLSLPLYTAEAEA